MLREAAADGGYPLIEIIGPNEFLPDYQGLEAKPRASAREAQKSFKAYSLLDPNLVYISPASAQWFAKYGYTLPKTFVTVDDKPVFVRLKIPGEILTLGLVLAPPALGRNGAPSEQQVEEIRQLAEKNKPGTTLMGLVTPWGFYPEHLSIEGWLKDSPLFNLVLGAGVGSGINGSVNPGNPSIVWSRSDHKGYSITVIDFFDLPTGKDWQWKMGKNVNAASVDLKAYVPADPDMIKIIGESAANQ